VSFSSGWHSENVSARFYDRSTIKMVARLTEHYAEKHGI